MDKQTRIELCQKALAARKNAYCPYSGVAVGAALLCSDGSVFCGANIENAAYSAVICAERAAFAAAVSAGKRDFAAMAVAGGRGEDPDGAFPPCGECRQVMAELCRPDFEVILSPEKYYSLRMLLPQGFTKDNL